MLRSLYAGVSGLLNHQSRMDVLGNNIANINTVGFKGGRMNFAESVNQMVNGATKTSTGMSINPMQIGLGMKIQSVDTMFTQGALENTGNVTDMAIEGDGFFVLNSEGQNIYTRNGIFSLDATGKLVNSQGIAVQGWMADSSGTIGGNSTSLQDIVIDSNYVSEAIGTENVYLTGNLNAGLLPVAEVWTSGGTFTTKAIVNGGAVTVPLTVAAGVNDQLTVEFEAGSTISEQLTLSPNTYADSASLVAEINAHISANANISGKLEAVDVGGSIKFRSTDGNSDSKITLRSGTNDVLADLGFSSGDTATAGSVATGTTDINDLLQVTTDMAANDAIDISGTAADGSAVNGSFTYGVDGTTVQSLVDSINTTYGDATATLDAGKIILEDSVSGDSSTTITLTAGPTNTGSINLPGFFNTSPGFTGKTSASVVVYDSLGAAHNLVVEFTKTENLGEWTWQVVTSGDEKILNGGAGKVTFDQAGALSSFTYENGASALEFNPGNGAQNMSIALHAESNDNYTGLSQFDSVSTLTTREQDGRPTGDLVGMTINRDGTIVGTFSNGEDKNLAQLALAQFNNNGGLVTTGEGLYKSSMASGTVNIYGLHNDLPASIVSGALEMSNIDLAKEFTDMITAQRGFQANSKIITTTDQMIDEIIRMKR